MGFRSGLIAGHFRTLQRFVLNHFCVLFEVCFGSLSCWKTHDLWWRPSFLTLGPTLCSKILCVHGIMKSEHYQSRHPVPEAAKQPQNICEPSPCLTVGTLFFSFSFSVNGTIMYFTKKLYLGLICPDDFLPKGFWLPQVSFGKLLSGFFMSLCQQWGPPGSPPIMSHLIQMVTDSASWRCCTLCLQVSLNLFGSWSRFFIHQLNNPSLQSFINFSLPSTSREVSYSGMGCKLLDDVVYSRHRNIKISEDGLVALRLSMLFHNFGSQILRQFFNLLFFSFFPCSVWYTQTQRLSLLFSILTGCKCDFYITNTCFLPQVNLDTNHMLVCPVHFRSSVCFLCFCPNANKINKREYQSICNCNNFLGEVVHYLTSAGGGGAIFFTMTVYLLLG